MKDAYNVKIELKTFPNRYPCGNYREALNRLGDMVIWREAMRKEVQQRKQNPQIQLGHIDNWKSGYLDAINEFLGVSQK